MKSKIFKAVWSLILSSLFVVVFFYILKWVGFFKIQQVFRTINWIYFVLAFVVFFLSHYLWARKWELLVRKLGRVPVPKILTIIFASSFASATTPGPRLGGEPVRSYYLSKEIRKTKSECFATVIFDRSTNTIGLQILYVLSFLFVFFFETVPNHIRNILLVIFVLFVGLLVFRLKYIRYPKEMPNVGIIQWILKVIYRFSRSVKKKYSPIGFKIYARDRMNKYTRLWFEMNEDKPSFYRQIILGISKWVLMSFTVYLLFIATGTYVGLLAILVVQTIAIVIVGISFIPGGIGLMESIMIALYYSGGIDAGIAATVAILNRLITYFYSIIIGLLSIFYLNRRNRKAHLRGHPKPG